MDGFYFYGVKEVNEHREGQIRDGANELLTVNK